MRTLFPARRRLLIASAAILAVAIAIVLALTLTAGPPPTATVARAQVVLVGQGAGTNGLPWFGASPINLSGPADGYPFSAGLGAHFNLTLQLFNGDSQLHDLSTAAVNAPFRLVGENPTLPCPVPQHRDFLLDLTVLMPSSPGTYSLQVTLTTYG
ncbi:MAG: hypothetical protein ACREC5_05930 [Thermoplasmata archaeon]